MKQILSSLFVTLLPMIVFAQDHGHAHGSGGENEHLYPVLGVFALLIVVGGLFFVLNKKKK